jgi:class 3 adenylate cyclase
MSTRIPRLVWYGIGLALAYWLIESLMHTLVFDGQPLSRTLLGEDDPNELWMRLLVSMAFVGFGWLADRSMRAERHLKEDALRINRLLQFVDSSKLTWPYPAEQPDPQRSANRHASAALAPAANAAPSGKGRAVIDDMRGMDDEIGQLALVLQDLSSFVEQRFKALHALLALTHEINQGLLLDEVLDKAYETLRSVLPYDRLSVALLESQGQLLRARWVRADYPEIMLRRGDTGPIRGSSLEGIIASGEPRIINDLSAYLNAHPASTSTGVMLAEGIRSSLTCPLISIGRPIGFMFFSSRTPNTYMHVHIDLFKLIAGHLSVMVEKSNLYQQILDEKKKSERLLLNVMPARIAARLNAGAKSIAEDLPMVNILFIDIVAFTGFAGRYPPGKVLDLLENVFVPLDRLCDLYDVEKIKTSGDEYIVMSGRPASSGAEALARLAEFALEALARIGYMRYPDGEALQVRLGMQTGQAVGGIIGQKKFFYDIWGDAVNTASRMQSSGVPGRIHVTEEVHAQLQQDFLFEARGRVQVRGKGLLETYFLVGKKRAAAGADGVSSQLQRPEISGA